MSIYKKSLFIPLFCTVIGVISVMAVSSDTSFTKDNYFNDSTSEVIQNSQLDGGDLQKENETTFHQQLKQKFIEGGVVWMTPILLCFILGLAIVIERILYLHFSSINNPKFIDKVEQAVLDGGVEKAKDICRNTRGPVASIFYQGLSRSHEGLDMVEKSIITYGSVQMGLLEKGLTWISLFITLSPMLGFLGTVVGMIQAFDAIEAAGEISPALVAGGIKVALITTVGGLIVAMILQVFYNYLVSKIDSIVTDMEDASISLVDILIKQKNLN